jgi:hypothetical protein
MKAVLGAWRPYLAVTTPLGEGGAALRRIEAALHGSDDTAALLAASLDGGGVGLRIFFCFFL